ncbi:MAG: class IV adenylate cyclase [Phycisphaerae bacterium]|nr:class IV adenylate cyclase [Phycisphaerae bacterium]NIR66789.1 class IV adenylate cyclase [candidate division Zixibacteria bacterium]NIP52658.1 class IV adenylate cyclase [Phycisphaerae bacterium]NIS49863.1 class IV adenylate cyclase [Phycisphaerae bacterium]NIU07956.1 class IV adenylate cyclase [Phycisphaerae bacterium]
MHTEIEAKLKVDSLQEVERKLGEAGAKFVAEQLQNDTYFDDAGAVLKSSDRALRLRRQSAGQKEKTFLTYKGAKEKNDFKKRLEIEIEVGDGESVEKLLYELGYEKALVFEKRRQIWQLDNCIVCLDELPLLGCFVEIEGPDGGSISGVKEKLGMSDLQHIVESYACLMQRKLNQLGKEQRQVLL